MKHLIIVKAAPEVDPHAFAMERFSPSEDKSKSLTQWIWSSAENNTLISARLVARLVRDQTARIVAKRLPGF